MPEIVITKRRALPDGLFEVVVLEESGYKTTHTVRIEGEYVRELGIDETCDDAVKDLLCRSFLFLLERESKESILREFNLRVISEYFPEYKDEIGKV